nr:hypothetical protein CPGR_04136 [Mycolicibacterium malmesburyense]
MVGTVKVLPAQHHLDQRVVSERASGVEAFDEDFEGHVLMFIGGQAAGADLLEQLRNRGVPLDLDSQNQRVDEEPDQLIECGVPPPGDREADGHVGAGGQFGQHHRQRGLDHHEARRLMVGGHPGQLLLQLGRPVDGDAGPALVGDRWVGPIGGQLQPLGQSRQHLLPVTELPRDAARRVVEFSQRLALPKRVVDILHRQRRPNRGVPCAASPVSGADIAHQRGDGPAVSGDVVHHRHQHMLVLVEA